MIFESKFSMGEQQARSRALPWATPTLSGISSRTMSPSSLLAAQWAQVAPTFPAPMMLIFARFILILSIRRSGGDYRESGPLCNVSHERSRSTMSKLILIKHVKPMVEEDVPSHEWELSDE